MTHYTLFVDESGQSGIKKIRTSSQSGASRYMTMGGALISTDKHEEYRAMLKELAHEFGKSALHCSKISHLQICKFASEVAKLDVVLFGVVSLKSTLGIYKKRIKDSDKLYYNKCAQYLLERLGMYADTNELGEDNISVCFEDGNFEYAKLRSLISRCRANPIRQNTQFLKHVNPNSISVKRKDEESLLEISDLVAHALFRCVDDGPGTFGMKETRYVDELSSKFWSSPKTGKVIDYGIHCVNKLEEIEPTPPVANFFRNLVVR